MAHCLNKLQIEKKTSNEAAIFIFMILVLDKFICGEKYINTYISRFLYLNNVHFCYDCGKVLTSNE